MYDSWVKMCESMFSSMIWMFPQKKYDMDVWWFKHAYYMLKLKSDDFLLEMMLECILNFKPMWLLSRLYGVDKYDKMLSCGGSKGK